MSVYSFVNEHGHEVDCLESLITEHSEYNPYNESFVLAPGVDMTNLKEQAAMEAGRGYRLSALKKALRAIKNASQDEILEAKKLVNSYL